MQPEQSYVRVLNGFAASLDPRLLPALERDPAVQGVFPVRAAYPAAIPANGSILETDVFATGSGRRPEIELPGFNGSGITVALLDTGVDTRHPFLQGRLLPGLDMVDPGSDASAEQNPTQPGRPERHGTELAGLVVGVRGPAGIHGVAPGASILPIRVAGWQPDSDGGVSVYGRTDQVLAGLEAAVDPNGDGDAHDAVRIALVGVVEPFASFPDAPLQTASDGALALDTLVVAPAGNDGAAGPGSAASPRPAARPGRSASRRPTRAVEARRCTSSCARACASSRPVRRRSAAPSRRPASSRLPSRRSRAGRSSRSRRGTRSTRCSTTRGTAASPEPRRFFPTGPTTPEVVRELAAAGVRAVLVDGPIPAGSLGVDEPVEVPIVGIPSETAAEVRAALAAGAPVELAVGAAAFEANPALRAVAAFSSTGLALDGGARPALAAPGVGLVTSVPGRSEGGAARYGTISGSSAAAAVVAGAAALLADARPDLDAGALRGALVATARRGVSGAGTGLVDLEARLERGARGRPARRRARRARRRRYARDRHRAASQRVAQAARGSPPAGCRDDRGQGHDEPRARRPPAGGRSRDRRDGGGGGAPGGAGCARGRAAGIRRARRAAAADPVERGGSRHPRARGQPRPALVQVLPGQRHATRPCWRSSQGGSTARESARSFCRSSCSTSSSTAAAVGSGGLPVCETCCRADTRSASPDAGRSGHGFRPASTSSA